MPLGRAAARRAARRGPPEAAARARKRRHHGPLERAPETRSPRAATCRPASPRGACQVRPPSYPARHLPPRAARPVGPRPPEGPTRQLGRSEKGSGRCGRAASGRPRSGTRAGRPTPPRPADHRARAAGRGRSQGPSRRARGSRPPRAPSPWRGRPRLRGAGGCAARDQHPFPQR